MQEQLLLEVEPMLIQARQEEVREVLVLQEQAKEILLQEAIQEVVQDQQDQVQGQIAGQLGVTDQAVLLDHLVQGQVQEVLLQDRQEVLETSNNSNKIFDKAGK